MSRYDDVREKILSGNSDNNISETDMRFFLSKIGAEHKRTKSSHIIYRIDGVPEVINIQPIKEKSKHIR